MCGRYTFYTEKENTELDAIIRGINEKYKDYPYKTGEIFPTNVAPVLSESGQPELMKWGFPNFQRKGVIINARSESAIDKRTFKKPLLTTRCVIPSTGFFEWTQDENKVKYLFRLPSEPMLYMAGLYNVYENERRFVILTTDANESVSNIHNRMPLVLQKEQINHWIEDRDFALRYLHIVPPLLEHTEA